jgi:hypothetical protein
MAGTTCGIITYIRVSVIYRTVVSRFNEDYFSFGFNLTAEEQPLPKCVVCGENLGNQDMVPSKLKRHYHTKHSHLYKKSIEYFKRLTADQTRQTKQRNKITIISEESQEASYTVVQIVKKKKKIKSHTIAESIILPACCKIVKIMFGEEYKEEILKIPMSHNTTSRSILDMSQGVDSQLAANI